jgi:hypothetical protein
MEIVGDSVILRIDESIAFRCWCPEEFEHLLDQPDDPDDAVAVLRWSIAQTLDFRCLDELVDGSGVLADRILAFMRATASKAGDLLTFAEVARLTRFHELRLEDRELRDEAASLRRIANPYIEATQLDYAEALRRALEVRDRFRAANPDAAYMMVDIDG